MAFERKLDFTMQLEEDIGAELEEFILYTRLGLFKEATEMIDLVLQRHIPFFPVFAETALFLAQRNDTLRLEALISLVEQHGIQYDKIEEEEFVVNMKLYCFGITPSSKYFNEDDHRVRALNESDTLVAGSATQVQTNEIAMLFAWKFVSQGYYTDFFFSLDSNIKILLNRGMLWEAFCLFLIPLRNASSLEFNSSLGLLQLSVKQIEFSVPTIDPDIKRVLSSIQQLEEIDMERHMQDLHHLRYSRKQEIIPVLLDFLAAKMIKIIFTSELGLREKTLHLTLTKLEKQASNTLRYLFALSLDDLTPRGYWVERIAEAKSRISVLESRHPVTLGSDFLSTNPERADPSSPPQPTETEIASWVWGGEKMKVYPKVRGGCDTCRMWKTKCDEKKPVCSNCSHTQRQCSYPMPAVFTPTFQDTKSSSTKAWGRTRDLPWYWEHDEELAHE